MAILGEIGHFGAFMDNFTSSIMIQMFMRMRNISRDGRRSRCLTVWIVPTC